VVWRVQLVDARHGVVGGMVAIVRYLSVWLRPPAWAPSGCQASVRPRAACRSSPPPTSLRLITTAGCPASRNRRPPC
jgi:hypothetical protein